MEEYSNLIKTFKFYYLYHTTVIFNKKSLEHYRDVCESNKITNIFEIVNFGEFPTKLDAPKWFTISEKINVSSPWMKYDEVFLKYKTKREIKLVDLRYKKYEFMWEDKKLDVVKYYGIDGFISYIDFNNKERVEVCLINPQDVIMSQYEIINFYEQKVKKNNIAVFLLVFLASVYVFVYIF
jgi:hypothetical protein